MIERDFVRQKKREFQVQEFISESLKNVGHSYTELQRTPLGDKVIIHSSRPGLIVGRKGQNISKLTGILKTRFNLENPQVEISDVENPMLDAKIVAERIASSLERFGSNRFKGIMHKTMDEILSSGALGVELRLSGKLPSSRAKSWRVYGGHLKKCGDAAIMNVRKATVIAKLKSGVIGIQVNILPASIVMPDAIIIREAEVEKKVPEPVQIKEALVVVEEKPEEKKEEAPAEVKKEAAETPEPTEKPAKKARKKKSEKKKGDEA